MQLPALFFLITAKYNFNDFANCYPLAMQGIGVAGGDSRWISSKGETTKRELATWLAHREPMGTRPPRTQIPYPMLLSAYPLKTHKLKNSHNKSVNTDLLGCLCIIKKFLNANTH